VEFIVLLDGCECLKLLFTVNFHDDEAEEDNENCVSLSKLKRETMKSDFDNDSNDLVERAGSAMSSKAPVAKTFPMQPLFQPSATPEDNGSKYVLQSTNYII
jgi:hypothetical protein